MVIRFAFYYIFTLDEQAIFLVLDALATNFVTQTQCIISVIAALYYRVHCYNVLSPFLSLLDYVAKVQRLMR